MTTNPRQLLCALALAGAAQAGAQTAAAAPDLVLLPAAENAWRVTVGHWQRQVELTGSGVSVPAPSDDYARQATLGASAGLRDGRRESLTLDWSGLWSSYLRIDGREPLDLRPWLGGTLELDLYVGELAQGGVRIKMGCGNGCERAVTLHHARAWKGQGWQHVSLALSCFERENADFSRVAMPFLLEATGSGRVSVANLRFTRSGKPTMTCPDYRTESTTPAMQTEAWAIDWWQSAHEKHIAQARALLAAGRSPRVVFIGDSITQAWGEDAGRAVWQRHYEPLNALNLGIGGDRTENVLWRLQHGALDGLAPQVAVMMIGTNNTGHRGENPETTAAGIKRLVDEVRQRLPATKILLLAVFPRGEKPDDYLRGLNERVNKTIAGYADGRSVFFLDLNAALLDRDGTLSRALSPDLLHFTAKGYEIWQREMDPTLQKLLNAAR